MKIILTLLCFFTINYTYSKECSDEAENIKITQSVKWYRNSAEKNALYRQAFANGEKYIKAQIKETKLKKKAWGVVLDIDETTLDNTSYFAKCKQLADNEDNFSKYVALKKFSVATPGAKELTCNIKQLGGYVSLVSNRDGSYPGVLQATLENLNQQKICFDQVVLANNKIENPRDKNPRFKAVITGKYNESLMFWSNKLPAHEVIAYFGDNIQDFPKFKQNIAISLDPNSTEYNKFGNGYFILPNPIYGSWQVNKEN